MSSLNPQALNMASNWAILLSIATLAAVAIANPRVDRQAKVSTISTYRNCRESEFKCESGRCIPKSWRCDGDTDCEDGDDEVGCSMGNKGDDCGADEYKCQEEDASLKTNRTFMGWRITRPGSLFSNKCIPKKWQCDGEYDCPNKDDEIGCQSVECQTDQFKCPGYQGHLESCIPRSWICDGQSDCIDMSDEKNCTLTEKKCEESEFRCLDNKKCIFNSWKCDGDQDCDDGSDELNCDPKATCNPKDHFMCKTVSFCVPHEWKCDGEADCADQSDELDCPTIKTSRNVTCHPDEFRCANGVQCISQRWRCDGDFDCTDHSDELGCVHKCTENQKQCKNGVCLDKNRFCDGYDDCTDGSDEFGCPTIPPPTNIAYACDQATEYTCNTTTPIRCIKYTDLCRNEAAMNDCPRSVCSKDIAVCDPKDASCYCRSGKNNAKVCYCLNGFELKNGQCVDINECEVVGSCDQICTNTIGSFKCDCHPGYKLYGVKGAQVPTKCRANGQDPLLLLSNRAAIRRYDLITNKYHPLVEQLESAVAMDYWHQKNTVIWSDVAKEKIMMCQVENKTFFGDSDVKDCLSRPDSVLVGTDIQTPDGLAVDWIHGLLFWTDTGLDRISVLDLVSRKRKVIIDQGLDEPRAIAVDPSAGLIFWTDWGNHARIERAGMNGEDRMEVLTGSTVRWPNGLALDILEQRIYWADAKVKMISSSDYYGKNVRTVLHSHTHLRHPFSLTVFEERLYWTDWDQEGVLTVNKFRGDDVTTLLKGVAGPMTVRVYHEQAQPSHPNKCMENNCAQMCLPRAHVIATNTKDEKKIVGLPYQCVCESGFKIDPEQVHQCVALESAVDELVGVKGGNFSMMFMMFILVVAAVGIVGYMWKGKRSKHFSALQFDNPIYRRTVEDPDTVDIGGGDNTLGAIPNNAHQISNPPSQLVLNSATEPLNTENLNARPDFYHPNNYAYDQENGALFNQQQNQNERL
ncbi:unnamed protein product [Bursaphelenchus xylophilus]|uniref:(pine wood nematode) hypothetical protein n=1 Tax=Bursaphelenchus xylophilus TaxID=6326 RepID=A0A1I7SSJ3_BURXY|nr:unnamed protein product [Bursaphelenchus xylophilus]CAG9097486.1 unnamed protein product [Bursaphelenchus xylophilus]